MFNDDPSGYARRVNDGTYDAAPIRPEYIGDLDDSTRVQNVQNIVRGLAFNCRDELMQNAYLRMALCSAFSPQSLEIEDKLPAEGILPSVCRVSGENYREAAGKAELLEENAERAQLFMQFALKETEQTHISVQILCTAEYETAMRRIIQCWQKVFGVLVAASTAVCTEEELQKAQRNGDFQIALVPIQATSTSAMQSLYDFTHDEDNGLGVTNEVFDGYMQAALTAPSPQSAAMCCRQAESYLIRTGVFYPLFAESSCFAFYPGAVDILLTPCGDNVSFIRARKTD